MFAPRTINSHKTLKRFVVTGKNYRNQGRIQFLFSHMIFQLTTERILPVEIFRGEWITSGRRHSTFSCSTGWNRTVLFILQSFVFYGSSIARSVSPHYAKLVDLSNYSSFTDRTNPFHSIKKIPEFLSCFNLINRIHYMNYPFTEVLNWVIIPLYQYKHCDQVLYY